MRLLKILLFFFIVHYIRRFYQMYQVMKEIQRANDAKMTAENDKVKTDEVSKVVEADFKVMDP